MKETGSHAWEDPAVLFLFEECSSLSASLPIKFIAIIGAGLRGLT
jgi:hypothetical protein